MFTPSLPFINELEQPTTAATLPRLPSPLRAYVGQTRASNLIAQLAAAGIGECVTRGQLPPRRAFDWFYDNGAFVDAEHGRPFNYLQYSRDLRAIRLWRERGIGRGIFQGQQMTAPSFIVLPDLVAQGQTSLKFSLDHLAETREAGAPCYLALQDGMTPSEVSDTLARFPCIAGLFIGGTVRWKLDTAATWCALGRRTSRPVHIGRVGTLERIAWAASIGASSIDSSLPLWERPRVDAFIRAIAQSAAPPPVPSNGHVSRLCLSQRRANTFHGSVPAARLAGTKHATAVAAVRNATTAA